MKNKDKELLLECLRAMLPYNVECMITFDCHKEIRRLKGIKIDDDGEVIYNFGKVYVLHNYLPLDVYSSEVKPCLRPISTISDEEIKELSKYVNTTIKVQTFLGRKSELYFQYYSANTIYNWQKVIKWLNSKHFDTFGAVERGIAIQFLGDKDNRMYFENGKVMIFD